MDFPDYFYGRGKEDVFLWQQNADKRGAFSVKFKSIIFCFSQYSNSEISTTKTNINLLITIISFELLYNIFSQKHCKS